MAATPSLDPSSVTYYLKALREVANDGGDHLRFSAAQTSDSTLIAAGLKTCSGLRQGQALSDIARPLEQDGWPRGDADVIVAAASLSKLCPKPTPTASAGA